MKIRIRTKLAAALAVPLVALVAISGFEAVQAAEAADDVERETELATVAIGPSSLTTELQNERNYTALDLIGLAEAATLEVASVDEAREQVDTAIADLEAYLAGRGEIVSEAFAPAFEALEADLAATRGLWDDFEGEKDLGNQPLADDVFERFTTMTQAFFDATETIATAIDDNTLRNGSEIVDQSNRRGELQASITRLIVLDMLTDGDEDVYRSQVAALSARAAATEERISQLSVGAYADVAAETTGRPFDIETQGYIDDYLTGESVDIVALLAAVSAGGADDIVSSAEMATDILLTEADRLTSDAEQREQQFLLLAAGVVILAIVSSWAASRSITRPLRKLRAEADEMARNRLPAALDQISRTPLGEDVVIPELEPIEVKTRDEVHEVVDVLNDVQERTLALAADQAVLRRNIADSFVNLGRRNQNLLDRQLEFITELEQSETEPEELESLFRLDHLATRMRRNAESLLVLAGVESPRQWSAPVDVDDVIRAALGEVEDYQRVNVRHLDPIAVKGEAAAGLSHVLAELIENALHYSPPGAVVEMKGRHNHDGYVIAIDDDGIGMSAEDLDRANRRLSGEESYTVAPSRYLGHYVAGNLATRFGIAVRLQDSPAGGVTATVLLPSALVATPDETPAAAPTRSPAPEEVELDPITTTVTAGEPSASADRDAVFEPATSAASDAPATLDEALGRPGFDGIESADDLTSAIDGPTDTASDAGGVPSLPKRVPGAQRPDLQPTIARRSSEPATPTPPAPSASTAPEAPAGAFGFLSGYSAAANGTPSADPHVDGDRATDATSDTDPDSDDFIREDR